MTQAEKLSPEQYHITRRGATEPPFSSPLLDERRAGTYHCVCCAAALFSSKAKYDSASGWPSFTASVERAVKEREDRSHGMIRIEVACAACAAHLGHVFPDGPPPGGLRYCINGLALDFIPE